MLAIVFRLFSIISNTEFHNVYFVMQNLEYVSDINMGQAQPHQKVLGYFVLWDVWRCDSGYYLFLYSRKYFCQVRGILEHLFFFPHQKSILNFASWNIKFVQNRLRQTKQETNRGIIQKDKIHFLDNGE